MQLTLVAGARPNFMKVAPLLMAARRAGVTCRLVHTGQHYDAEMSDRFFDELELPRPDAHLGVGSGTHAAQTARVMAAFDEDIARASDRRGCRRRRRELDPGLRAGRREAEHRRSPTSRPGFGAATGACPRRSIAS